ncbi:MAG: 50S ribosome-binding GTPase [Ignavibacteria bacterium]|jgi:ferrous iron transport protein B|nr:50S ribosome-binding GTPase [Ignavibacteria bacterium]MDH7528653.1 FeoB small GTPase domain-containing protein [Ignavibacteria bacterium]
MFWKKKVNDEQFVQIEILPKRENKVIALAGNPNTGKSTIFNRLTGLKQHTGNWPGKTVTRAEGVFKIQDEEYTLIDLPGTYSLLSTSEDEEIARDFILFGNPDATVIVCDASVLERNLNLAFQIMQITNRCILCVNLIDEAKRKGIEIDKYTLERELGIPVVLTNARSGEGIDELKEKIHLVSNRILKPKPIKIQHKKEIQEKLNQLVPLIEKTFPGLYASEWIALRLLEGDLKIRKAIEQGNLLELINKGLINGNGELR